MFARTQSELESIAKRASESYLKSGEELTSSLSKLASEFDLSCEQIKRVCELANHRVNDVLFKSSSSKLFSFKLADSSSIISTLQSTQPEASGDADYEISPKMAANRKYTVPSQWCISLDHGDKKIDKTASQRDAIKILTQYAKDAQHIKIAALRKIADIKAEMYDMVERMIGSGYKLEDLYMAAKTASEKKDAVKDVFSYIADRLKKEGKLHHAIKISLKKLATSEDLSGADGSLGKYPVGDHWVKVVMTNGTMKSKFQLLDEAQNEVAKADTLSGHISDTLDMVKTIKK